MTKDLDVTASAPGASLAAASRSREVEVYDYGIVEHIGEVTLPGDGRKVFGIVMTFPGEPPNLKLADIWNRTPFRLLLAAASEGSTKPEAVKTALERLQIVSAEIDNLYLSEAVDELAWSLLRSSDGSKPPSPKSNS